MIVCLGLKLLTVMRARTVDRREQSKTKHDHENNLQRRSPAARIGFRTANPEVQTAMVR
jgi:hypothetical protein